MIVLFTDFGLAGPYIGQVKARLLQGAPGVDIIDLFSDAPTRNPKAAAYLLAAYDGEFPEGTVFACVVDPGVGSARRAIVVRVDGCWYVGPDNGLFEIVARQAGDTMSGDTVTGGAAEWWDVTWRPERMSATFHGRDIFAPVAARLARGEPPPGDKLTADECRRPDWPDDLDEIIYVDTFGNAATGRRAATVGPNFVIASGKEHIYRAETFSNVPPGEVFWYENSSGLAQIAVNGGSAADHLNLEVGSTVAFLPTSDSR